MNAPVSREQLDDAKFRAAHVGASEVAALFDESPYLTRFELFHRKTGNIAVPEFNAVADDGSPENERVWWGVRLEEAILQGACERYGYTDVERHVTLSNGKGLGAHPDTLAWCPVRKSRGYVEIKMADWLVRKGWGDEPPMHYLLQSQTGQGLAKAAWGDVLVLVGGNSLERFQYDFRPKIYAEIERRVEAFWQSVREGKAPPADYTRDLGTIKELYADQGEETIDLQGDNRAAIAAAEYLAGAELEKEGKARKEAAAAELFDKLRDASFAFASGFTIKSTLVSATPERVAEPGEIISGRKSYRRLTIKERND
jgi:predicted phage-related endonuclease